jgi:cation diffusion facilitator CzcD-associated flavoprotein CzcO
VAEDGQYEVIVVGAGVAGIYQLHRLVTAGVDAVLLEAAEGPGGTWYNNRYPGCRFDSESYTYGYSFSKELLHEWDWSERFSSQPENLRYLNFVIDKFDLRRHMQFRCRVEQAIFDEDNSRWRLLVSDGRELAGRFLLTALGALSISALPRIEGIDSLTGRMFHTHDWPHDGVPLAGQRVAVIGTGATAVQLIGAIAGIAADLTVFQRRPNWCAPLHNGPLSTAEMEEIKTRYDEIFAACARTPGGFIHEPDRRPFFEVPPGERRALWEKLYGEPGFGIWLANFRDTFINEEANAELTAFMADKIRARVHDPALADKLIPKDHGFGYQRVPLETGYYEAYNRDDVHLVDVGETPIERITPTGLSTTEDDFEFDIIVFATGFDAITGAYDRIDIRGVGGQRLKDKWAEGPVTFFGLAVSQFPNLLTVAGPQSASAAVNYPRGIETSVNWVTDLLHHMWNCGYTRVEATANAERWWAQEVTEANSQMLMRKGKGWFTGYNANVAGHERRHREFVYAGGAPKYQSFITALAEGGYDGLQFS